MTNCGQLCHDQPGAGQLRHDQRRPWRKTRRRLSAGQCEAGGVTVTESRSQPATPGAPPALTLWLALGAVYLIWGSTYLGIRVVVEDMPALGSMGVRFVVAGVILGGWLMVRRGRGALRVSRRSLLSAGLVGALLLLGGNGGVAIAEQTVPSGLAALLVAAMPLWLVLLRTSAGDHPRLVTVVGTAIGFLGIAVLGPTWVGERRRRALGRCRDHRRDRLLGHRPVPLAAVADAAGRVRCDHLGDAAGRRADARRVDRLRRGVRLRPRRGASQRLGCAGVPDRFRVVGRVHCVRLASRQRARVAGVDVCLRQPGRRRTARCPHPGRADHRGRGRWRRPRGHRRRAGGPRRAPRSAVSSTSDPPSDSPVEAAGHA